MAKSPLRSRILKTLAWFDVFRQAVTAEEISRYLIGGKSSPEKITKELKNNPAIVSSFGFYALKNGETNTVLRVTRQYRGEKLWKRVRRYRWVFRFVPFLKLVAVGNTLAFGWADENSDIDLFVVAHHRRLFTTRFFLTILMSLLGVRRHKDKVAGRFCLSFFAADTALDLSPLALKPTDPYLAFWIATLVPIWGKDARLVARKNLWIRNYFPNLSLPSRRIVADEKMSLIRRLMEKILNGDLGDQLEAKLKNWQISRAHKKQTHKDEPTAVVISDRILKFHERDRRREYRVAWEKMIKKLK